VGIITRRKEGENWSKKIDGEERREGIEGIKGA
jgi:hypothetical protein